MPARPFALLSVLLCACLLLHSGALRAQSDPYAPRGARSYLVNYGAIKGDRVLANFAARRFVLLDEAWPADITLVHKSAPAMPVLVYRDVVALHRSFPEYAPVSLDERAFLHSAEPSSLVMDVHGDSISLWWMPDRRALDVRGYLVLGSTDSLGARARMCDSMVTSMSWRGRVPAGTKWISIATAAGDSLHAFDYGAPVRISARDTSLPLIAPRRVSETRTTTSVRFRWEFAHVAGPAPDSVTAIIDLDRNNTLDVVRERRRLHAEPGLWVLEDSVTFTPPSYGGFECVVDAHAGGRRAHMPSEGAWTTSVNNRVMNDYYGFYVMDVGCPTWRRAYIAQVLASFSSLGYSGLFEDDTWYRVEPWGVDAFPPVSYSHAAWKQNLYGFLDSIRTMITPRPAYFNGLYAAEADSILIHTDGGMTEGFAYTSWSQHVTGDYWKTLCNVGLRAQHCFGKLWLALGGTAAGDGEGRMYALASYLLVADSLSMYANSDSYQVFAHTPEFDLPLGNPVTSAALNVDTLRKPASPGLAPLYVRTYDYAYVIVNPSATQRGVFDGGGTLNSVTLLGGLTTDGGRVTCTAGSDTIGPKQARIYLAAGLCAITSPLIDSIVITPDPIPADGTTEAVVRVRARDSSCTVFRSNAALPLRVTADFGALGGPRALSLVNDGSAATSVPSWYEARFRIPAGALPAGGDVPFTAESSTGLIAMRTHPVRIAAADTTNLVLNFSFEIDNNDDGIPDLWRPYGKGFEYDTAALDAKSGVRSIHVRSDSLTEFRGAYTSLTLNQDSARDLVLSGWSRAINVSSARNADYALYADLRYNDDTPLYGQTALFNIGTHEWEYSSYLMHPLKPVKSLTLYALFRKHSGEAWFDHIALRRADAPTDAGSLLAAPHERGFVVDAFWPQPVRREAHMRVRLDRPGHVTVALYSLLGTRAAVLHDARLDAGEHDLRMFVPRLPAGAYLCRIDADGRAQTVRVLVMR